MITVTGVPPNWVQIGLAEALLIFENGGDFKGRWYIKDSDDYEFPFDYLWNASAHRNKVSSEWWGESETVACVCFVEVE